ncbi:cytochrome C oxidase subunit II [Halobiforma lacisalsi AJ5]|uniref:Cytochrome C oxidase subunit II n=1 Tax=Natronobacterium lacisalsi AJ5 TaxID=358396 RepID=M0LCH3_NATLA|nr:cytochrome c oxidase subunit II [Halobiforma lacisalsi]APW99024.1 cytochrome C oxidase subunit II [Halobiforma lacisalsi AJ5]EMA31286.1 cytochrome c oxidase subunit II [Halobiforma lacisalsi AJ5]
MRIHQYERVWLLASMVLIVGFIATITYGAVGLGITMVDDRGATIAPDEINEDERFGDPRVEQVGDDEYEVYAVAMTFAFQPDPIEIPADSEVTFYVTSRDVIHSFYVVGTNTNTMVIPGEISVVTVEFDEPGEYGLICTEYCGAAHHEMEGQLAVLEDEEFDLTELEVEAPDEVEPDGEIEITATVTNGQLEAIEETVTVELGDETLEESVTVEGDDSESVTLTVDAADLGEGDHDWTASAGDLTESGTVSVVEGSEDDAEGDDDG